MLTIMLMLSLTQAASVMVSQAYGGKKFQVIPNITNTAIALGSMMMLIVAARYCLFPQWIIGGFVNIHDANNAGIVHNAKLLLLITAVIQFIDCTRDILNGTLRGLQDSKTPMWIGIACNWLISLPSDRLWFQVKHKE